MDIEELLGELKTFALWPRCFSVSELLSIVGSSFNREAVRQSLLNHSRFVCLSRSKTEEDLFVYDATLFNWFVSLTTRAVQAATFRLTEHQVAVLMSHLLPSNDRWASPPPEGVRWATRLGFLAPSHTAKHYVLPMARLLSFLPPPSFRVAYEILEEFGKKEVWKQPLNVLRDESIRRGFAQFKPTVARIVDSREGLSRGRSLTLEEIGKSLGLTRERVRQLEEGFWNKILIGKEKWRRPFVIALLSSFMSDSGSVIVRVHSSDIRTKRFLAKCAPIPCSELSRIRCLALFPFPSNSLLATFDKIRAEEIEIDSRSIAAGLERDRNVVLGGDDVRILAEEIAKYRRKRLGREGRVYLALRAIGRPAHYSRVCEYHNALFPEFVLSEGSVHTALGSQRRGMVWTGLRGTYALKEWGYRRPSKKLFEAVTEIVKRFFSQTGRPVALSAIIAEMGKYRQMVNISSVAIASHLNPDLRRVSRDSFIPGTPGDLHQEEIPAEELDRILRDFGAGTWESGLSKKG